MTISLPGSQKPSDPSALNQTELSKSEANHRIFLSGGTIVACLIFIGMIITVTLFQKSPTASILSNTRLSPPAANATPEEQIKILELQKEIYKMHKDTDANLMPLLREANTNSSETLKWLTTSTFPMLSAWIGTVLTFYFASGASRAANEGYQKLLEEANKRIPGTGPDPNEKLKKLKLSSQVKGLTLVEKNDAILLTEIKNKMEAATPRKKLLILKADDVFRDIVTLSDISSFLTNPNRPSGGEAGAGETPKVSLAEYLEKRPPESQQPVIFAAPTESIYDAYTRMLNQNITNLIVTESGNADGKVLAFLTNIDIEALAR